MPLVAKGFEERRDVEFSNNKGDWTIQKGRNTLIKQIDKQINVLEGRGLKKIPLKVKGVTQTDTNGNVLYRDEPFQRIVDVQGNETLFKLNYGGAGEIYSGALQTIDDKEVAGFLKDFKRQISAGAIDEEINKGREAIVRQTGKNRKKGSASANAATSSADNEQ